MDRGPEMYRSGCLGLALNPFTHIRSGTFKIRHRFALMKIEKTAFKTL